MNAWKGKVAVVTGAASGIGNAIARDLVKQSMKVIGLDWKLDGLKKLELELNNKQDGVIKGIKCDISNETHLDAAINWIESNWGPVNVLINNAGIYIPETVMTGTGEGIRKTLEVNVIGTTMCTKKVISLMKKYDVQQGYIININSIAGHRIPLRPLFTAYVASKHSGVVISQMLKDELALENSPIRVTSISPGFVLTNMARENFSSDLPKLYPEDISNCVQLVLSTPSHVNISQLIVQPTGEIPEKSYQLPSK